MRRETVLYRDETGRGWRLRAGARVPAGWLTDAQYQTARALLRERRMQDAAYENREQPRDDVRTRGRSRRANADAQPEGPS